MAREMEMGRRLAALCVTKTGSSLWVLLINCAILMFFKQSWMLLFMALSCVMIDNYFKLRWRLTQLWLWRSIYLSLFGGTLEICLLSSENTMAIGGFTRCKDCL